MQLRDGDERVLIVALGGVCAETGPDGPDLKDLRLGRTSSPVRTILQAGIQWHEPSITITPIMPFQ
jgi:hypothetical protein